MENKVNEEELKLAVKHQEDLQKAILDIGVIETRKHAILHKVAEINLEIEEFLQYKVMHAEKKIQGKALIIKTKPCTIL